MSRPRLSTPPVARRTLVGVALAGLLVPLAACSGGGDAQAFCEGGEDAITQIDAAGSLGNDPEAFAAAIGEARDKFEAVEAPDEIADDWQVFTDMFGQLDDALSDIDVTDQEAFTAAISEFSQSADSEDLTTAGDDLSTYITENCDA